MKKEAVGTIYGICNSMKEVEVSREATEYISNNYAELVKSAKKFGAAEQYAYDVVNDVYISFMEHEENGEGYDMCKGKGGSLISLEQAVYGKLKGYCKNARYRIESIHSDKVIEVPSTNMSNDFDSLNEFEKAYNNAESFDDVAYVDQEMSIVEELTYLLSFERDMSISVIGILDNLDTLISNVKTINSSLFSEIKDASDEFVEAFRSAIKFAGRNPEMYKTVLAEVKATLM